MKKSKGRNETGITSAGIATVTCSPAVKKRKEKKRKEKKRKEKRGPHCVYVYVVERNGKKTSPNAGGSYLPNTLGMSAGRIYK